MTRGRVCNNGGVTGSGFPQPFAVIQLSEEALSVVRNGGQEAIHQGLEEHLAQVNATLPPHEKLAFLTVAKNAWAPENGLLTPTMKIRRARIEQNYTTKGNDWYETKSAVIWEEL